MCNNEYRVSRRDQIILARECVEDAKEIAVTFSDVLLLACRFFDYRIDRHDNQAILEYKQSKLIKKESP